MTTATLPGSGELLAYGKQHLFPCYARPDAVMVRGSGATLWDSDGRAYLDLTGGLSVTALGHAHPDLVRAISEQAATLGHLSGSFWNDKSNRLAFELSKRAFGDRVFFANSGAEANEAAIKLARRVFFDRGQGQDRFEIVSAERSFHGRTLGALAATGNPRYHEGFAPLPQGFRHVPYGDARALREAVTTRTALVMLEPMQGEGGVIIPPAGYLAEARRICDDAGALLHFDEVQVGMGRTGTWFCHEHEGVTPDTMSLAKALGGGLPLGALVTRSELANVMVPGTHASTFGGNPISCAAGLAYIETVERDGLLARATRLGEQMKERLGSALRETSRVRDVRGRGCLVGIELDVPGKPFADALRNRGVLVSVIADRVLRLAPPFITPDDQLAEGLDAIIAALRA